MTNSCLLTIIIPAYNSESTIEKLILSIGNSNQKYFEIIVIDDASVDATVNKIYKCAPYNCRIIELPRNYGSGVARNYGLKEAKGRYISFIDSDDWVEPGYVKKIIREISENKNIDIFSFGIRNIKPSTVEIVEPVEHDNIKVAYILDKILCSVVNKVYRRNLIEKNNIDFPELRRSQDVVFNARFIKHVASHKVIPDIYYNYDCTQESITRKPFSCEVLKAHDVANQLLWESLHGTVDDFGEMFFARTYRYIFMYSFWRMIADRKQGLLTREVKLEIYKELESRFSIKQVLFCRYLAPKEKTLYLSFKIYKPLTYMVFITQDYIREIRFCLSNR